MNERIQELAEQSGLYVDLDGTPWPRAMSAEESETAYKKFAQLIVQECARVQHKRFCEHGDVSWDILMEHFGVEE